jgi:tetratricopeptide (TPR) repeat protein
MYRIAGEAQEPNPPAEGEAAVERPGGMIDSAGTAPLEAPPAPPDGVALVKAGNLDAAEAAFREALDRSSEDAGLWHNLAVVFASKGNLDSAIVHFEEALKRKPAAAETHRNLALALSRRGRPREAEDHWRDAVRLDPALAAARHELGNALRISGRLDEAAEHLREAVRLRAGDAQTHHDLGLTLAELGQPEEAQKCYEAALELRPEFPEALNNLGILLEDRGAHAEAEARYRASLKLFPRSADTLNNLGVTLAAQRRHEEAVECYRQALQLKPRSPLALNNLGNALRTLGEIDEAMASLRQAIEIRGDYAEAHNNLGISLMEIRRRDEAVARYEKALCLRPNYPEAHLNRSLAWLGEGDFSRGWTEYEWRWCGKEIKRRAIRQPLWSGALAPGRTLYLYFEQGLGDTLQFIRYVELARRRVGRVIVEVQAPLVPLLSRCRGIDRLIPSGAAPPRFDLHLPLMSLPGALGTQMATIPSQVPYIFPDPKRVEQWKDRLAGLDGYRVGIGWQGNRQYRGDRQRSIPVENFARLASVPGVRLVSLQKGEPSPGGNGFPLLQFDDLDTGQAGKSEVQGAFLDTAAILPSLDLVITSDTALAHLAGAMGTEVWIALPFAADWRWLREREDSPWYPTARLFRQRTRGDWQGVFERMANELALRVARRQSPQQKAEPRMEEAKAAFRQGTEFAKAGKSREALSALRAAIEHDENYAEAHHNLGVVLARDRQYAEAIAAFERTLQINPDYGEAAGNLGLAFLESGETEQAIAALRLAIRTGQNTADVYNHLGVALLRTGLAAEAVDAYQTALRLAPEFAAAHINLAQAYRELGRLDEACLELEWKWSSRNGRLRKLRQPRWTGESLEGRTILIYADESAHDTLKSLPYTGQLKERGARVIVACAPDLVSAVSQIPGIADAVPIGDSLPEHDFYVPLLSLARLLAGL